MLLKNFKRVSPKRESEYFNENLRCSIKKKKFVRTKFNIYKSVQL